MKIAVVNHSDSLGGASVVSRRLTHAMCRAGHDARMLVSHRSTDDPLVTEYTPQWRVRKTFLAEHLRIFAANGFDRTDLFKASIATDGLPLASHPLVAGADAVILAWVNQGMLSLDEIRRIASATPTLWVMHDMWNLTGICHHAGICTRFRAGCGNCPLLHRRAGADDLSHSTFLRKQRLYDAVPSLRFVAVSSWLRDKAAESGLTAGRDVAVIPNAFPVGDFHIAPTQPLEPLLGLPEGVLAGRKIVAMGAARLDDPVKGLPYAAEILDKTRADDAVAVFFGNLRDAGALGGLRFPHYHVGRISDPAALRELYAHATAVISTSLYETLPGTLIEGQAAGCTPVAFDSGGQRDIIDDGLTGRLIAPYDTDAFAAALTEVLASPLPPEALRASVASRFSADAVAARYAEILSPGQ